MNSPTPTRSIIGCLLTLIGAMGLAACGAQDGDAAFSDIALPTFSKDRVAAEAPVEVRRMFSAGRPLDGAGGAELDLSQADVSPDGRYVTDIEWRAGNLEVRDLATGETRKITNNDEWNGQYPDGSAFSPDGKRVAYVWRAWVDPVAGWDLRSIGTDGTDMTVHLSFDRMNYPEPEDWSKDGRYILITLGHWEGDEDGDYQPEIATVNVTTNETRVLKALKQWPVGSFFSPDGRFVAFDSHEDPDSREHDLFLVTSDGRRETTLMQTPDHETLLGWLPDGSGILFHRNAEDSQAIWKLPLRDGRPSGPPELVRDDAVNMIGLGFSDDAFFYGEVASLRGIHMGSFDLETGRVLEALEPIADPPGLGSDFATWSPDGTRLVYFSAEQGRNQARTTSRIIVRSLTGEILQDLPNPLNRFLAPQWTEQGLLVWVRDRQDRDNLSGFYHLISLETGEATYLRSGPPFTVSADGSRLFIVDRGGPVTEYDLVTRTERVLFAQDGYTHTAFAGDSGARILNSIVLPDGDKVLHWVARDESNTPLRRDDRALEIVSLSTGETRVITGFARVGSLTWSADGRYVVTSGQLEGAEGFQLLRVSVEDGSVIVLAEGPNGFGRPRLSPDGRHFLTTTGEYREEIWRMTFNKD